jgi:uncharacterized protein YunC (DUF1805 family)
MNSDFMETIKVTGAGLIGFVTQLTALDLIFKVSIGFLTCCYLTLKCFELVKKHWKGKDND